MRSDTDGGWTPATWEGWLTLATFLALVQFDFWRIDHRSHSVSDTLINFILHTFILIAILLAVC